MNFDFCIEEDIINICICCEREIEEESELCEKCLKNSQICNDFCELIKAFQENRVIILPKNLFKKGGK